MRVVERSPSSRLIRPAATKWLSDLSNSKMVVLVVDDRLAAIALGPNASLITCRRMPCGLGWVAPFGAVDAVAVRQQEIGRGGG